MNRQQTAAQFHHAANNPLPFGWIGARFGYVRPRWIEDLLLEMAREVER